MNTLGNIIDLCKFSLKQKGFNTSIFMVPNVNVTVTFLNSFKLKIFPNY